jgi:hypothetical protein
MNFRRLTRFLAKIKLEFSSSKRTDQTIEKSRENI